MKKTKFLFILMLGFTLWSCQQESDNLSVTDNVETAIDPSLINKSAEVDGVHYTFKNVSVNPDLVVLNDNNSRLVSNDGDSYKIEVTGSDVSLKEGVIVYLQTEGNTSLFKVNSLQESNNVYTLETEAAGLGNLFNAGSLELSVDVDQAQEVAVARSATSESASWQTGVAFDIFNFVKPFQQDDFTADLNSSLKAYFNVKLGFGSKSSILPNMVEVSYELHPSINPYFTSAKGVNGSYKIDYIDYVPADLIQKLKTFDISIDVPLGDFGTLPAKVGIDQINLPAEFTVNSSEQMNLRINTNGILKVGYVYYNNVAGKVSQPIYENSIVATNVNDIRLNGEISSDAQIVIIPRISLVDNNILKVSGKLSFGLKTFTSGGISTSTNEYIGGSMGTFSSKGSISASTLGLNIFNVDLLNKTKDLWNVGSFNKVFTVSNLKLAKPSKTQCALRSYGFDITVNYQYPIYGKKITNTVEVTYDVYDDRKSLIASNQKATLQPTSVTDTNFTFNLCIPFRINVFGFTTGFTRNTGYIRNLKITDSFGNVAQGPAEILLGSPYNNSFWK